jgi:hypothetical protein
MGWTLLELQEKTGIEKRTINKFLREELQLHRTALKLVPHALTEVENWTISHLLVFSKSALFIHPRTPNTIHCQL